MKQTQKNGKRTPRIPKSPSAREITADTTQRILAFFFSAGIFAWRANTVGVPIHREGQIVGFRPSGKVGIPDVIGVCPPGGRFIGVEIKTGKDRLRPEQEGFIATAKQCGAVVLVVKSFDDFRRQWEDVML